MGKRKGEKVCAPCRLADVEARLDQAHDAMAEAMAVASGTALTESALRLEESRFWTGRFIELARHQGVEHVCPTAKPRR